MRSQGVAVCGLLLALLAAPALAARGSFVADSKVVTQHRGRVEVLDADARIYLHRNFLTDEECDHLRDLATKRLERSGVVDTPSGGTAVNDVRTSDGMFFNRAEDEVIEAVERRLAEWTLLPVHFGESLQVLRYRKEQKYDSHWDYFFHKGGDSNGGNRYATVLMYLHDVEEGGETKFPKIPAPHGVNIGYSECAKYNLAYKPRKGDALLFHSMTPDGKLEERSMHMACPVVRGEKWSMTKWYHARHYRMGDKYDEEVDALKQRQAAFLDQHGANMGPDTQMHAQPNEPTPVPRRHAQESSNPRRAQELAERLLERHQQPQQQQHHYVDEHHDDSDDAHEGAAHHYYSDENHGGDDEEEVVASKAQARRRQQQQQQRQEVHHYAEEVHGDDDGGDSAPFQQQHHYAEEVHDSGDEPLGVSAPQPRPSHQQGQRHRESREQYRARMARQPGGNF